MKINLFAFSIILGMTTFVIASPPAAQAKRCLQVSASGAQNSQWDYCQQRGTDSQGRPIFYCCTH